MEYFYHEKSINYFSDWFITFFLSTQVSANDAMKHTSAAMEEAGHALSHGEDGHAKMLKDHAEKSLKHALEAENAHVNSHHHMKEGIKHLKEAIKHPEEGAKHMKEAIGHMQASTA